MSSLTSRFAGLNPFSETQKSSRQDDDEDIGQAIDTETKAGGGNAGQGTRFDLRQVHVNQALKSLIVREQILSSRQVGLETPDKVSDDLYALLAQPHVRVPPELTDRSHPLPDYFISSSHNTYLTAHQLYGNASAEAYETVLLAGSRCVEIDAWDGDDKNEPKVTHGYTLTSHTSFRSVCETLRDVVDKEAARSTQEQGNRAAPILLSLENHCSPAGQRRLVDIMKEVFGDRLLSKAVREKATREQEGTGEHVTLAELENKLAVIVEYHFPDEPEESQDEDEIAEGEEEHRGHLEYEKKKREADVSMIVPELAELGIYAQSVKPPDNSWFEKGQLKDSPHHPLINVSESGLAAHMPQHNDNIARHNANHLMRVYPKGIRISSKNLKPVPYWGIGAQVCALNWQTFGASMQLNEALFTGTDGYVLKPESLRNPSIIRRDSKTQKSNNRRLSVHVAGAINIPVPEGRDPADIKPYLTCTLIHPDDLENRPPKRKTAPYKPHRLSFLRKEENSLPIDPIWDEILQWDYADNELVFLRLFIKSDDAFARNPAFTVGAVRLLYVQSGAWRFMRMLDLQGHETMCFLLVKFDIQ